MAETNGAGAARAIGLIIVAEQEGIEDTLHTLNQFADWWFDPKKTKKFVVQAYANLPDDAANNPALVKSAHDLGRQMATALMI